LAGNEVGRSLVTSEKISNMNDLAEILKPASGSFVQRNAQNYTLAKKCQITPTS
jgi:hypothetical protein